MKRIALPCGETLSALGQGTWRIGEDDRCRKAEIAALRHGIDLGLTMIDTAEMYGEGRSETLVGEAIAGRREEVFIVTKVYPHNASRHAMPTACDNSRRRLGVEVIDLYLLHWSGSVPLAESVEAFEGLQQSGKIRYWGVSNLDLRDMVALEAVPGGAGVQTNQLLYNLTRRGIEWDLLPWLRQRHIPVMAYSPFEQGGLLKAPRLVKYARQQGMTPAQVALAWLLAQDGVVAIPKTGSRERLEENARALSRPLTPQQSGELDALFAAPTGPVSLEMI